MKNRTARWRWCGMGLGVALAVAGLGAARGHADTPPTIEIKDFKYGPPVLTVPVGTTVTWVNHDEEPHTVTSATGVFGSGGLVKDEAFTQRFAAPGTYQYVCALHPHMKATVVAR